MIKLDDDGHCFACGRENPSGLGLDFSPSGDGGVSAEFLPLKAHQGYKDIVHGGIISTALDEAMAKAVIETGVFPVTAEITVRFREPLMVGQKAVVTGRVEKSGRLIEASASVARASDGALIATASAKLIKGEAP